jgi:hypothetical protein
LSTLDEATAGLIEAINDASIAYGVNIGAADRAAIARKLSRLPVEALTAKKVAEVCAAQGVRRLPVGFASTIVTRLLSLGSARTLMDVLVEYRQFAIDALSAEFGAGKSKSKEDSLRNNLRTYLPRHAEVEAQTGRGKTDLYLPELDTVIEVKVWTNQSTFDAGVEEVGRYIHTKRPKAAVMVVFGDRGKLPAVANSHTDPFGTPLRLEGLTVPVLVVPFEGVAPSKALQEKKARIRSGR